MATTTNTAQIDIKVNTGPLSSSLKELKTELLNLKKIDLDIISPEEQSKVINRMSAVRGKIEDMNYSLKNFDPGDTFGNLATALRPVATGMAALTSGMMVFGVESEKAQELQQRFNALISVGMILQELADSSRLKALYQHYLAMVKEIFIKEGSIATTKTQIVVQNILNASMGAFAAVLASVAAVAAIFYVSMSRGNAVMLDFKSNIDNTRFSTQELANTYDDLKTKIFKNNLETLKSQGKLSESQVKTYILEYETKKKLADNFAKYQQELNDKIGTNTIQKMKASLGLMLQKIPFLAKWGRQLMLEVGKDAVNDQKELEKQYEEVNKLIIKDYGNKLLTIKNEGEKSNKEQIKNNDKKNKALFKSDQEYYKEITKERLAFEEMNLQIDKENARLKKEALDAQKKEEQDYFDWFSKENSDKTKEELDKLKEKEALAKEILGALFNMEKNLSFSMKKLFDELLDGMVSLTPELDETIKSIMGTISRTSIQLLVDSISYSTQENINNLYKEVEKFEATQSASLERLRKNNLITEEEYNRRKEALAKQVEQKEREAKKKAFKLEQDEKIKMAIISGALAAIRSIAASPQTFGLPFIAYAGVETAAQIGLIKSQKPPSYAKGNLFNEETFYRNSIVGEAGPEALMSAAATNAYLPLLDAINTSVGGNSFTNQKQPNDLKVLVSKMDTLIELTLNQKIVLPVQSLNEVQSNLSRLEAQATLG